jgi:hypothetical protein
MHWKIKTSMFEKLISKPLKVDEIQISLLVLTCLTYIQNVATRKRDKLITHFLRSKSRNPKLGLVTKARGYKVCEPKMKPGSHISCSRECKRV